MKKGFTVLNKITNKIYYPDDKDNDFVLNAHGKLLQICYSGDRAGEPVFVIKHLKMEDFWIQTISKEK